MIGLETARAHDHLSRQHCAGRYQLGLVHFVVDITQVPEDQARQMVRRQGVAESPSMYFELKPVTASVKSAARAAVTLVDHHEPDSLGDFFGALVERLDQGHGDLGTELDAPSGDHPALRSRDAEKASIGPPTGRPVPGCER
jgi:hypothetical protein